MKHPSFSIFKMDKGSKYNTMHKTLVILFLPLTLAFSVIAKAADYPAVKEAIALQQHIISDSLFIKILTELEAEGQIDWNSRTGSIKEKLSDYSSNTAWLLSKYKNEGGFKESSVILWRKWNRFSSTTASTGTCATYTRLNTWNLDRDKYSVLNTLIHERVHSFCVIHPNKQTREANQCDAAYIAGDLAEVITLYRAGEKERKMDKPICPSLLHKIEEYKLISVK